MRRPSPLAAFLLGLALAGACSVSPRGLCETSADCLAGLSCDGGVCTGCAADASCRSWEACTEQRCQLRAGRCLDDAACDPAARCDATHTCVLRPGRCDAGGGCEAWQSCQATACVAQPGRCDAAADCTAAQACSVDHACIPATFDPAGVALWGTLAEGTTCAGAVAPLSSPDQGLLGFGCGRAGPALLSPAGDLVYADAPGGPLRRFRHDPMAWDPLLAVWAYPLATEANDEVVLGATPCGGQPWTAWTLQAGSGAVRYACAAGGAWDWFDVPGNRVVAGHRVFAWTAGDHKLASLTTAAFTAASAVVLDPGNAPRAVAGLPAGTLLAVRTSGEAFLLALRVDAGGGATRDERWSVDAGGAGTLDGLFAAAPTGFAEAGQAVLDGAGRLFVPGRLAGADAVVRRPLAPEASLTAYTEASAPARADDFGARPFGLWVRLDGGSRLVAGP